MEIHQVPAMVSHLLGVQDQDRGESQATGSIYAGLVSFSGYGKKLATIAGGGAEKGPGKDKGAGANATNPQTPTVPTAGAAGTGTDKGADAK